MDDYKPGDPIEKPFFVMKPWKDKKFGHEEKMEFSCFTTECTLVLIDILIKMGVKLPYFYQSYAPIVAKVMGMDLY